MKSTKFIIQKLLLSISMSEHSPGHQMVEKWIKEWQDKQQVGKEGGKELASCLGGYSSL